MAPKKLSRLVNNPPSASPSQEEEVESSEEDEEVEEEEHVQTPQKNLSKTKHRQNPKSSSSSSSEEADDDDDGTKSSPTTSDFTVKPIANHPTKKTTKNQQPINSKERTKPSSKRALELPKDDEKKVSSKKKSKLSAENGEGTKRVAVSSSGGGTVRRVWSEDDEIAILKGMIDYQNQNGVDPQVDMAAFHEFVKGKCQFDVTKVQLYEKIRGFRNKFFNNLKKGENGADVIFSKTHDIDCFDLSKKIWGKPIDNTNGVPNLDEKLKSNDGKAKKSRKIKNSEGKKKEDGKKKREVEEEVEMEEDDEQMIVEKKVVKDDALVDHEVDFSSKYPYLSESCDVRDLHMSEALRKFTKENISLIDHEKAKELDEKWKRLRIQEIELFSKRSKLMIEQAKLVTDAMKRGMSNILVIFKYNSEMALRYFKSLYSFASIEEFIHEKWERPVGSTCCHYFVSGYSNCRLDDEDDYAILSWIISRDEMCEVKIVVTDIIDVVVNAPMASSRVVDQPSVAVASNSVELI